MNPKRLLNYEFLRDNIMCMDELDKQTSQILKSMLLLACYDLSYIKFVDARFFVDTMGGDKVTIILGLISRKHSTQIHYEVSADSHCHNASIKRKFGVFELNKDNGTWNPVGACELGEDAGELLSLIIKNVPREFIIEEGPEDLPVTTDPIPPGKLPVIQPDQLLQLKKDIDDSVDGKLEHAAERIQAWITDEFCPVLQEWLEKALGRKLDVKIMDKTNDEHKGDPDKNKSNLI